MTEHNPTLGNVTSLPKYLQNMQDKAMRLSGVMAAIATLTNEGSCMEGQVALIFLAEELALELSNALDSVCIPKGIVA
ncbi:MAG: hypothetical protein ACK4GC_08265 [Paracoccaceae bacterium]